MDTNTQQRISTHVKTRFGDGHESDDTFDTVDGALEEVKRLISWLGYVSESEYSERERKRLTEISRRFAGIAQPIANKYID